MLRSLQKLMPIFKRRREILFVYVFGSQARKEANRLSDIDIGVFIDETRIKKGKFPYGYEADLLSELDLDSKKTEIDLVLLNGAPILLRHRCMTEGKLLYCGNEVAHARFKVKTLHEYWDTKPLREKIKKAFYRG